MRIPELFSFLRELKSHNNKEWFEKNKADYQELRKEFIGFVSTVLESLSKLDARFGQMEASKSIFRINRDVRFSKNKDPYKTNFGMNLNLTGKKEEFCGFYLHLEPLPTPCLTYTWGETEDYTVDIQDAPFNSYVWTGATSNNYATASNWTPSRTLANFNDKLTFNSTSPISITNVQNEEIRVLEVTNGTILNLTGASGSALVARDTLSLGNGSRIRNVNSFSLFQIQLLMIRTITG